MPSVASTCNLVGLPPRLFYQLLGAVGPEPAEWLERLATHLAVVREEVLDFIDQVGAELVEGLDFPVRPRFQGHGDESVVADRVALLVLLPFDNTDQAR